MLLRSVPQQVRDFCLHHATGDTFQSYRQAAKRWEQQQRIFQEMSQSQGRRNVSQVSGQEPSSGTEFYDVGDQEWQSGISAVSDGRCHKCGSKKHVASECATDLSKTKCFRCNGYGHVSMNCHLKKSDDGKEKGKGSGRNAKGGKGNRKGKLYEVSEEQWNDDWWSHDWDWSEYDSNVYQVSGWEQWDEYSWTADDGRYGSSETWKQEDSTEPVETPEKTVGSLVLSPVLCLKEAEDEVGNGLFLEEVSHSEIQFEPVPDVNSCDLVQEDPVSPGSNLFVCPQPFLGRFVLRHRGHDEFDNMSENFHDGLVCEDQMRVKVVKLRKPTFLNHEGELSACHECERLHRLFYLCFQKLV